MLRGINVSGHKRIRMQDLKALYESIGFINVTTYVQSGNAVFDSRSADAKKIAASIEAKIDQSFGYAVSVFVRTKNDFHLIIENNPFLSKADSTKLHVTFLAKLPAKTAVSRLPVPKGIADEFLLAGKEIYLYCPNGYGSTKISNNFFERHLDTRATTRNWRTVGALYNIAEKR